MVERASSKEHNMHMSHGLMAVVALAACAPTTELVNTWKDPEAEAVRFNKVVTACLCKDAAMRRTVEDQLSKRIKGSTASYTLISDEQLRDKEAVRAKVREGGFDGAVVMLLVGVDRTATYVPGTVYTVPAAYGSMYGGWGYGWNTAVDPGYVREDQQVDFNTNVYAIADSARLVWASRSQTMNPSSVPQLVDEIVSANVKEMQSQKLLTK
jgi:hypothetical protein